MERKWRGTGDNIIVQGDSTKKPTDWKEFLSNDNNKQQLIQLLLDVWTKDSFAKRRNIILHLQVYLESNIVNYNIIGVSRKQHCRRYNLFAMSMSRTVIVNLY